MTLETRAGRGRRDPAPLLWGLTGAAWVAMLVTAGVPAVMAGMPAMAAAALGAGGSTALLPVFAGGWVVMVAAMMLPTTVPMARLVARIGAPATPFYAAYLAVWLLVGLAGLASAAVVARTAAGVVPPPFLVAGALALAGAAQFSPVTRRCLAACRDPRAFLFTHYRRGAAGAWSLGLRHALFCVGCCWALMLLMFVAGVASLLWMLVLTAVMVTEKAAPRGERIVVPVGVALVAAAAVVVVAGLVTGGAAPVPGPVPMPM